MELHRLSELYDFQYGLGNNNPDNGGIYPVYGSNGIIGGYDKYNNEDAPVIGHIGANAGSVVWAKGKHFVTYNGVMCNIKTGMNPMFGYYSLLVSNIEKIAYGSAQPFISYGLLNRIPIFLPEKSIQDKIASILSTYDSQIEKNQKRIKLLEQMAENLYKEWFVRFRFPGYESAEFEGGVPKGWKTVKLCEISDIKDGVHNTIEDDSQGKYFLLSCKNIKDGRLVIGDNERTISEEVFFKLRKRTNLSKGDILISSVGTIGETTLVIEDPYNFEFQRSVAIIKPNQRYVTSFFMYEAIKSMKKEFENAAHGAAQQCLFLGDINKIKFLLPKLCLCADFDQKVKPLYCAISSLEKQTKYLTTQRDLLLPRLMSGKLEVKANNKHISKQI